jgi:hypothetical protein
LSSARIAVNTRGWTSALPLTPNGLWLDDWKHLTGTFTFGSGPTREELDEIIRQSLVLWGN